MEAAIAIYGAILASIAFAWQVFAWARNRFRLRLQVDIQPIWEVGHETPTSQEAVFRMVNAGSQPVTILRYGFEFRRDEPKTIAYAATKTGTPEPLVLEASHWHEWRLPAAVLALGPHRAWAEDANGKRYTSDWLKT